MDADAKGLQKAATLLIAMSKDTAARVLRQFGSDDVSRILSAAAELDAIEFDHVSAIIEEFAEGLHAPQKLMGTLEAVEGIAQSAFPPEEAAAVLARVSGRRNVMPDLMALPDARKIEILANEHPQVACVVLDRLGPDGAARALSAAPPQKRAEWLARMLAARPISEHAFDIIQRGLGNALDQAEAPKVDSKGPARIANIVNRLEPEEIDVTLDELEALQPAQAQAVRAHIFRFDDIVSLGQPARALVFDQVAAEKVVLALTGASADLKEAVLSVLGQRARRMVEAELSSDVVPNRKDVTHARRIIADTVLKLAETGALELPNAQPASAAPSQAA